MMTEREKADLARAEQNAYSACRERDAAVLTFSSQLADSLRSQLADVDEAVAGETFATVLEEVAVTRLREIRRVLRAAGIEV